MRTRTQAAEVLGSIPWHECSQSPPLAPPKSPGRLQCWVASGQTTNREGTQPHPSADKWIKVLLSSPEQQPALPTTSPSHQETCTSFLDSLIHQTADSRSKNYNPAACGTKTTFTERKDEINEEEIANLPEKDFRVMIVKMIQNLGNRMETQIEKIQEMFNKDLQELKNKQR